MPAEWAPHEGTIMGWPCREEIWGAQLGQAKADYAATANAVAAFEPLTMVCADARDADEARAALAGEVEVVELAIDDSWLRDSGPIFVLDGDGERAGVHFGFNSWGEKFTPYDADKPSAGCSSTASATAATRRRSCSRAARSPSTGRGRC